MTVSLDPDVAGRPPSQTPAQVEAVRRLRWVLGQPEAKLAPGVTTEGMAVVYCRLRGERRAAYIDPEGFAVTPRDGRWVRIEAPYNPPQLQIGDLHDGI